MFKLTVVMQPSQSPIDYLNQIAPTPPKRLAIRLAGPRMWLMIGIGAVILVIIAVIVANSIAASRRAPLEQLSARLQDTATIVENAQDNIKSSSLSATNSGLNLNLEQANREFGKLLVGYKINTAKLTSADAQKEKTNANTISNTLEDARLNATYDRVYATQMNYQLSITMSLLQKIYNSSGDQTLRKFLSDTYNNLQPARDAFANYRESSN